MGQQESWKIFLVFQTRKDRVKAATAKPAKDIRTLMGHVDLLPEDKRSNKILSL